MSLTQFVVIRGDLISKLNWPVGSVIAQGCHVSVYALFSFQDDPNVRAYTHPDNISKMTKVVYEIKNESQMQKLTEQLDEAKIDYRKWIEQPENILTAIATKPYLKDEVKDLFKKCQLFRPAGDQTDGNERKRPRLDPEPEGDANDEDEGPGPLKTFEEVKEAFEDFTSRVPDAMVPKLYKLLRDHEKAIEGEEAEEEVIEEEEEDASDAGKQRGGDAGPSSKVLASLKGDRLISTIIDELRQKLPITALSPGEENVFNQSKGYEDHLKENTVHMDSFLYDDDDIDDMCDQGVLSRNYCADCMSKNVKPLNFISHSASILELNFLFQECLGEKLTGKVFVDVGSRLGGPLYMGHTFTKAKKLIGIEIDTFFCDLQKEMVKKFHLEDRIEIINSDIMEQGKVLKTADVVFLNNVLEFFLKTESHEKIWKFLASSFKVGALIFTTPSLEQQFESGKVGLEIDKYFKKIPLRIQRKKYTAEEIEDLEEYHQYQVLKTK